MSTIEHRNGVPWHQAPIPSRWHRCKPQTSAWWGSQLMDRCACGALRYDRRPWIGRNDRRKDR